MEGQNGACIRRKVNRDFETLAGAKASQAGARSGVVPAPLIVDEKPICRQAMAGVITGTDDPSEVNFAACLPEALEVARRTITSLALVDLFTIGFDFEGLKRLVLASHAPVIAIDDRPNPTFARLAQQAGARGYACKSFELEQFQAVVRAVREGGGHFPREAFPRPQARTGRSSAGLSPRQLEVLKCIAVGMSNQEIARSLGISIGTVKLHTHAILRLTGTRNRTEAALIAGRFVAPTMEE